MNDSAVQHKEDEEKQSTTNNKRHQESNAIDNVKPKLQPHFSLTHHTRKQFSAIQQRLKTTILQRTIKITLPQAVVKLHQMIQELKKPNHMPIFTIEEYIEKHYKRIQSNEHSKEYQRKVATKRFDKMNPESYVKHEDMLFEIIDDPSPSSFTPNMQLVNFLGRLRPFLITIYTAVTQCRLGMEMSLPAFDEAEDVAVSILQNIIDQMYKYEEYLLDVVDSISSYYSARAVLIAKTVKYPAVLDYVCSVLQRDESFYNKIIAWSERMRYDGFMIINSCEKHKQYFDAFREDSHQRMI